jgi:hypothetical protein
MWGTRFSNILREGGGSPVVLERTDRVNLGKARQGEKKMVQGGRTRVLMSGPQCSLFQHVILEQPLGGRSVNVEKG